MAEPRDRFVRARHPDEKAVRREAILQAASRLVERNQVHEVSLNAIALEAGLTKPNLYRYFESREEILLVLFLEDLHSFAGEVVSELSGPLPPGSAVEDVIASVLVNAYAKRARLCRFLGSIASVLEYNVSARTIEDTKRLSLALGTDVASAIHGAIRSLSIERCLWLNNMTALLVGGLWPPAHPAPAVGEVLSKPEFAALRPDFARDLHEAVLSLIRGS